PHWPWSKSSCGSQLDVVYAGSGDLKSDKKLVLDKIRYSGFIPHVSFVSNDVYLDSPPGRTVLTELFATTNMRSDGSDGSHESGLFVTFTKKPYDTSLAEKVKSSKAKYFIVLHVQSGFNSSW
ncbi:MAG TPA: hypothetical protein VFL81_02610, partial [Candidatus Saccharimonadales bacterium]|nr:hypothetical protein [Candidatus Saccharimonadales bacterium]